MGKIDFNLVFLILYSLIFIYMFIISLIMIVKPNFYFENPNFRKYIKGFLRKGKEYKQPRDIKRHGVLLLATSFFVLILGFDIYWRYSILPKKLNRIIEEIVKSLK